MSFLGWPTEKPRCGPRLRRWRKRAVLELSSEFQRAFPDITYELIWDSALINAQAWRLGPRRYVRVYGGLARCQLITKAGLALMLAHETGHHLGGPPMDPDMPWMTWQGQADFWAAHTAMPRVFGAKARAMTLRGARQILTLHKDLAAKFENDEPDLSPECRYDIFLSGARGLNLPTCAETAFMQLLEESRGGR
jgi:hypothetical protein